MTDPAPKVRNVGGRPPHKPTAENKAAVQALASFGTPQDDIAKYLKIAPDTLRKHYADDLEFAVLRANAAVVQNLFKIATGKTPQASGAAMFWCKTRLGWRETNRHEISGADGGPIELNDGSARELIASRLARLAPPTDEGAGSSGPV